MLRGTIVSVSTRAAVGELSGDHASGVSSLAVAEVFDFNAGGGSLQVGSETYTYTSIDYEANTLTLSGVTTEDYDDGDKVVILPARVEKIATVVLDGTDAAIPARIMHVLAPFLPEGVREPVNQEYAVLLSDGQEYLVIDAPGQVPSIDPAAIGHSVESVVLDGPPDYWCLEAFGDSELLTFAEMEAVADPVWVAAVSDIAIVDGAITVPMKVLASDVETQYYPVWVVPLEGRQCRVVLDDVSFSGAGVGKAQLGASLQNDTFDYDQGYTDDLYFVYEEGFPYEKAWSGYAELYPESAPDFVQTPPLQSLTQQESASIFFGQYDTDPGMPYMAVSMWYPLAYWSSLPPSDFEITVTGLRVELQ